MKGTFAGEFDIHLGCVVRAHHPQELLYNESVLSAYLIPDGVHRSEYDANVFRYCFYEAAQAQAAEVLNKLNLRVLLFVYDKRQDGWAQPEDAREELTLRIELKSKQLLLCASSVAANDGGTRRTMRYALHPDLQFSQLKEHFFSFYTLDGQSVGLNIQSYENDMHMLLKNLQQLERLRVEEAYFLNVVRNKKDSTIKRGLLTRSLAVCSVSVHCVYVLQPLVRYHLDKFCELPHPKTPADNELVIQQTALILQQLFDQSDAVIREALPHGRLYFPAQKQLFEDQELLFPETRLDKAREPAAQFNISSYHSVQVSIPRSLYEQNVQPASLCDFFLIFQSNTARIFNAILRGKKSYESTIAELVRIAATACALVFPLNALPYLYPYEHLFDLDFLESDFFIAAVSNPLFAQRREWFDLCCDVSNGQVTRGTASQQHQQQQSSSSSSSTQSQQQQQSQQKGLDDVIDERLQALDQDFFGNVLVLAQARREDAVREVLYTHMKTFIDASTGGTELQQFEKESLSEAFLKRQSLFQKSIWYPHIIQYRDGVREAFKGIFAQRHSDLYRAVCSCEKRCLSDVEIVQLSECIERLLQTEAEAAFFLTHMHVRGRRTGCCALEPVAVGLLSENEEVARKAQQALLKLENFVAGKQLVKKLNFMLLYVYQNLKGNRQPTII